MSTYKLHWIVCAGLFVGTAAESRGQAAAVAVTMQVETNRILVGGGTVVRVYAQVAPGLRDDADRIFSWYVDFMNTNGSVASAGYGAMSKPVSDNLEPPASSLGFTEGANRRGIYDTFINLPDAGREARVELLRVPVTGMAPGWTRFEVRAGSGVAGLAHDFIVAPALGGAEPFTGGDYALAQVDLQVIQPVCDLELTISEETAMAGPLPVYRLQFVPCAGYDHTVEYRADLGPAGMWQSVAGAPHNTGDVLVTGGTAQRFYRVRAQLPLSTGVHDVD